MKQRPEYNNILIGKFEAGFSYKKANQIKHLHPCPCIISTG